MNKIINPFIYDHIGQELMPYPTIPPYLNETYSQCFEDVVVLGLFSAYLRRNPGQQFSAVYIEIGANHPVCTSATYLLYKTSAMKGILVEPNPLLALALKKHRPKDSVIEAAIYDKNDPEIDFFVSPENEISSVDEKFVKVWKDSALGVKEKLRVKTVRINKLLEMVANVDLQFVSIDVEGYDYNILVDIDYTKYRPFIIQIEPSDGYMSGNSDRIVSFLKSKDYVLVYSNFVNLIFMDKRRC
jgi:FkbM family methyltransferase